MGVEFYGFYGREPEQQALHQWLGPDRCRLIAILGIGGQGKTALAAHVARHVAPDFEFVIWRSLLNAPPSTKFCKPGYKPSRNSLPRQTVWTVA